MTKYFTKEERIAGYKKVRKIWVEKNRTKIYENHKRWRNKPGNHKKFMVLVSKWQKKYRQTPEAKQKRKAYNKKYRANNKEKLKVLSKNWNKKNPEKRRVIRKRYNQSAKGKVTKEKSNKENYIYHPRIVLSKQEQLERKKAYHKNYYQKTKHKQQAQREARRKEAKK